MLSPLITSIAFLLTLCTTFTYCEERPNIIFILADDLGYGDLSHSGGSVATPFIDQIAHEGMRFKDAHTSSSVCTPTRYGILTGRYNWRSPLKKSVTFGLSQPIIPVSRTTIATHLKNNGYHTGIVGKWHLGLGWQKLPNGEVRKPIHSTEPNKNKKTKNVGWDIDYAQKVDGGPRALGFDESFFIPASLDMYPYVYLRNDTATQIPTHEKAFFRLGPAAADFEAKNCLIDFAKESRAFIKKNSTSEKPFFLYLPLTSPHTPIVPSERWQGKSALGKYGDFLMETDWVVGEVLQQLKESGVDQNTLIIFTSDNGCSPAAGIPDLVSKGHFPNSDWRGHKADIFEGGHRVPFLARWPAKVKAHSSTDTIVCTVDFFKTVAEIIGTDKTIPDNTAEDSFSFYSTLKGQNKDVRPFIIHHSIAGQFAIRQGHWKLNLCPGSGGWSEPKPAQAIKDPDLPGVQLYHLEKDPGEKNNVYKNHPEVVRSLVNELYQAIKQGRTTKGRQQANDGWPNTVNSKTLELFPELKSDDTGAKFLIQK